MTGETHKLAKYKRIILCSDGTWLASNTGDKSVPSNVAKIARAIAPNGLDAQGNVVRQIVSYYAGLGTGDLLLQKTIYGGIGWGLDIDVLHIYDFIANNYEPGDELFFFGFSRGSFTVRSVAGLVCDVGILKAVHMSHFADLWTAYRANTDGEPFKKSIWYLDNKAKLGLTDARIKVVGVWDTVGELGIPQWPLVSWLTMVGFPINKQYAFHNTKLSKDIDYAFQALAIDEKRITFPPTLWHKTNDGPAIELQQCWFPGVHGNIGGQAEVPRSSGDREEIGDNTFAWMVDNLSGMLTFQDHAIKMLVEQHQHALNENHIANGWGCGSIVDNFAGLQGLFFRLLGGKTRTPGDYPRDPGDGAAGATNESVHPIVRIRKVKVPWDPPSLKGYRIEEPDESGKGWRWAKNGVQSLPEYVMEKDKKMSLAFDEHHGQWNYGTGDSLSRLLCPRNILKALDEVNRSAVNE